MCNQTHKKKKAKPEWYAAVKKYASPDLKMSIWQLVNTLVPYAALWVLMSYFVEKNYWITLGFSFVAALFLVRIFIIFHDCGHYNFFKSKNWCKFWGYITGALAFTPFHDWGKDHKLHHATSGNLDKRGFGDIWTLTVDEYKEASKLTKFKYRFYRTPIILFIIGPIFVFCLQQRVSRQHTGKNGRASAHITNALLLLFACGMAFVYGGVADFWGGLWKFFLIQFPVIAFAAIMGVWLFYVQHQFEEAYWEHDEDWTLVESALEGSSFYKLPRIMQWFSGNIGFHHIHHLSSKIPNYKLEAAYNDSAIFQEIEPLTIKRSLSLVKFRLWDRDSRVMVGYGALKETKVHQHAVKRRARRFKKIAKKKAA